MKELDKNKAYDLSNLNNDELMELKTYLEILNHGMWIIVDSEKLRELSKSYVLKFDERFKLSGFPNKPITDAKELFTEWVPKQGEKVLVSDDNKNWNETIFVFKHQEYYHCENRLSEKYLIGWTYIKPFKEEEQIKVGDWVKCTISNCFFKYDESFTKNDKIKITNPKLIKLLEQEIK